MRGVCLAPVVQSTRTVNPKADELKARTKRFALDVIGFIRSLPRVPAADIVGRQLLKSATGVAANYRSACRSRSHAEFAARIGVVLEEADESEFWLELLAESGLSTAPIVATLQDESRQLRAIFAASSLTARHSGP